MVWKLDELDGQWTIYDDGNDGTRTIAVIPDKTAARMIVEEHNALLDRDTIIEHVESVMVDRFDNDVLDDGPDFLMGASAVLQAIGLWPPPPRWVHHLLFIMPNYSVIELIKKEREE